MSHELRTPLNAVIGFSELLLDGIPGEINDEQRQCLDDILTSGQHLLSLIGDVLDISKLQAGKMELKLQDLDLADVIEEAVQTVRPMADEKRHRIEVRVEEDIPRAHADEARVRQILLNLLSNAMKFTPPGGLLAVDATHGDHDCLVSVTDNGIGIKPEQQDRIFEVFVRGETILDGTRRGSGLGLALARQLVELMGGRIWVESECGKGSRFSFTVPGAGHDGPCSDAGSETQIERPEAAGQLATPG